MDIILPKTSGFCYGVYLAVKEAEKIIDEGSRLIMYGEIVHNPDVVGELEKKGAITQDSIEMIESMEKDCNTRLLIRAHGVSRHEEERLRNTGFNLVDKTCPKVKRVHKIVGEEEKKGRRIVIVGNPCHPEVKGIVGQCQNGATVISGIEDCVPSRLSGDISVVVQTTFNGKVFESIKGIILDMNKDAVIYDTMCPATNIRQKEVEELSRTADYVIVLGGKKSSNSIKLSEIAARSSCSVLVEKIEEIPLGELADKNRVVVCGGSSTPYELIYSAAMYLKDIFGARIINLNK